MFQCIHQNANVCEWVKETCYIKHFEYNISEVEKANSLYSSLFHCNNQFKLSVDNPRAHFVLLLEIVLLFTGRRRSSADSDRTLQEALRTRLRVVESNSQDVIQLFKVSPYDEDNT